MTWGETSESAWAAGTCAHTGRAIPAGKLRPSACGPREFPADLRALLRPQVGGLLLVHAAAGYRKTTALAATHEPGWLWYNLDLGDRCPVAFASRLCAALGVQPLPVGLDAIGDLVAPELAARLQGLSLTITCDRYEHIGGAPELGRLLAELLLLVPDLGVRLGTRVRPALPLERLRLDRRLTDVGLDDLRLRRPEIERLLSEAGGAAPAARQVDFADTVLGGWPAAVQLWSTAGSQDAMAPLQPGQPLHDYVFEEVLSALAPAGRGVEPRDLGWLLGPGPLLDRVSTPEQRELADRLVKDRVGVVSASDGWRLHPLVAAVVGMHVPAARSQGGLRRSDPAVAPRADAGDAARVAVRAFGRLVVTVEGVAVDETALPSAARRLLVLLLCLPGHQTTSQQAAEQLWPRHLRRSALNSFNVALHGLRRMLEPGLSAGAESRYVLRTGRTYRLCVERMACDFTEFQRRVADLPAELDEEAVDRLEEAVRPCQGDFLATVAEEFARERRARLREALVDALERLGAWHAGRRRWGAALRAYHRLLDLEPRREDVWARALECYLAVGHDEHAVAAVLRCERALQAAGVAPSGLLRELHRRIRENAAPRPAPAGFRPPSSGTAGG